MAKSATQRKANPLGRTTLLAAIASSALLAPSRLTIKELDADVFVKRLTLGEREKYFEDMKAVEGRGNVEAFIIAIVDENNEPLFTLDDIDVVKTIPPVLTEAVLFEFNTINRFIRKPPENNTKTNEPQEDEDLKNS